MKKTTIRVLGFLLAAVTCAVAADSNAAFRAGAAKGNITPALGAPIIGGFHDFPSKHVHDDLWVRCLALDDGKTRVAFVVCDLLGIGRGVSEEARRLVQQETGVPAGNILVSAIHNHSAASGLGKYYSDQLALDDYQKVVARRIADTVRCALNNLAPARIGWATASEPRHVFNRRRYMKPGTVPKTPLGGTNDLVQFNPGYCNPNIVKPAGPTDPEICLFAVQTPDGRPVALFANYSLHYVGGVRGGDISADYFAYFNDRIQELLGADRQDPPFIAMLSNGTSGDINNCDFSRPAEKHPPYGKMRIVANDVAQKAFEAYRTIQWRDGVSLGVLFEEIPLRYRRPTPEQLDRAKDILARIAPGKKPHTLEEIYANRTVSMSQMPEGGNFPLQAFRIGDFGLAALPNEVFCEIGLELKRRSPFRPTCVVSLAHGYFGYLPTPEQHALGGYETWMGTCQFETDSSPKMVSRLLDMLTRLQKGK